MNERILELAEQAMVETQHEFGGKYLAFSKEKFAELIVADCVAVMREKTNYNKHVYTTYDQGLSSGVIETLVETLSRRYNINLTKPLE